MTFQNQVQTYTQTISNTDNITQWLTDGARILVNVIPERLLERYETALTDSGTGVLLTGRFVRASKSDYDAPLVKTNIAGLTDVNSIFYANARSPKCYLSGGKGYVVPSGGNVYVVVYPTVLYSAETISLFPTELEPAVVLYAAIRALNYSVIDMLNDYDDISTYIVVPPTTPDDVITIASFGTAPTYTDPTASYLNDYTNTETRLTADDTELSQAELSKIANQLERYSREQISAKAKFDEENTEYQASIQRAIQQAGIDQRAVLETYSLDIQRYSTEVSAMVNEVQSQTALLLNKIKNISEQVISLRQQFTEIVGLYANS